MSLEIDLQRLQTETFIRASPVELALVPRSRERQANGAWKRVEGTPRLPQLFRLIPQGLTAVVSLPDGTQRRVDYQLLGTWDAKVAIDDVFMMDGDVFEVIQLETFNQYEVRANVIRRIAPPG